MNLGEYLIALLEHYGVDVSWIDDLSDPTSYAAS